MRSTFVALVVGIIFGAGLALSDMVNPGRVLGFLDIAGPWDPTLALVMASALVPSILGYAIVRRMRRPLMAGTFCIPENRILERRLIAGSLLFGIGWGLAGICPGPAVAGLVFGMWQIWFFVAAMLAGMLLHRIAIDRPTGARSAPQRS